MSVLSFEFLVFLAATVAVYYALPLRFRWIGLLAASLAFYAAAGWQGLAYMLCAAGVTWLGAIAAGKGNKWLPAAALTLVFGAFVFVKYYDAASAWLNGILPSSGKEPLIPELRLIAPLGLSYFTLQSAGYVVDARRGKLQPERNPLRYLLFVSFFPQMTQGPISEWKRLAPLLASPPRFEPITFVAGAQLMLWGYFKKLVIADRIAPFTIAAASADQPGWLVLLGAALFAVRLYADFSGGMDVIRGAAGLFGIDMADNFNRPFFSSSVAEYWRRWHISLGAWFRAYMFFPLTVSRAGVAVGRAGRKLLGKKAGRALPGAAATVVIFLFVGLWHAASWNAALYGLYFGLTLGCATLLEPAFKRLRRGLGVHVESRPPRWFGIVRTLSIVLTAQYFAFTATPAEAFSLMGATVTRFGFTTFTQAGAALAAIINPMEWIILVISLAILFAVDFMDEKGADVSKRLASAPVFFRWPALIALILATLVFGCYGEGFDMAAFIYTQF
ncbi:MAG: hypothetical protein LBS11_01480 [Oscillospiraceae bacterium]|nr:hypothetical protein [Oscillospiraceae bacterium]